VLLDTNVLLDVLQRREPFYPDAARVFAAVETGRIRGIAAAHALTTVFYLLARYAGDAAARAGITDLLRLLDVAPVGKETMLEALALAYADLEDAVHMAAALEARADYLITRDRRGYAAGPLPTLTPGELLALL
jgi:predicted nucleic acid-binding protein